MFVTSPSPFHIMKPEASTWMKLSTWSRTCATASVETPELCRG